MLMVMNQHLTGNLWQVGLGVRDLRRNHAREMLPIQLETVRTPFPKKSPVPPSISQDILVYCRVNS